MRALVALALIFTSLGAPAQMGPSEQMRMAIPIRAVAVQYWLQDLALEYMAANETQDQDDLRFTNAELKRAIEHLGPLPAYHELQMAMNGIVYAIVDRLKGREHQDADIASLKLALAFMQEKGTEFGLEGFKKGMRVYQSRANKEKEIVAEFQKTAMAMQYRPHDPGALDVILDDLGQMGKEFAEENAMIVASMLANLEPNENCSVLLHPNHKKKSRRKSGVKAS